jgi:hypothetical protein
MVIATHMIGSVSAFLALCRAGLGAGARKARQLPALYIVAALLTAGLAGQTRLRAQDKIRPDDTAAPNAVLWRDPGAIGGKNLSWSSDPQFVPPAPPFRFIEEDTGGTRPKVEVTDAKGTRWNVKLSGGTADTAEVHAEVAATRLAWALGYLVEEVQYVREGKIEGLGQLKRAAASIAPDGTFKVARFEKRPADVIRTDHRWTFDKNPFVGTKELSGFMILMTMFNNWDLPGIQNTIVLEVPATGRGREQWYIVSDYGGTFGKGEKGGLLARRTRWNLEDYQKEKFLDGVSGRLLRLHYRGDAPISAVPIDHARWFAGLASQLTPMQVRQAFAAAGATPAEVEGFTAKFLDKIVELQATVRSKSVSE